MEFRLRTEDEAFRQEVRTFLKQELPKDWIGFMDDSGSPEEVELELHMRKRLISKNWLALAWPKKYGGYGADVLKQLVMSEEMAYHRAPGRDGQGIGLIGPCIMIHGTEEQKTEHLGKIARGEVVWCQGFSEPGSGSDLASLQTRAVADGDDYVINGSKIWTTLAHKSNWIHILTRTDSNAPKHKGISYFLLDMKTPGIEIRPLINMAGSHGFNQVFFTDVRVPKRNMLGDANRGWYVATTTLDFERSMIGVSAGMRRTMDDAMEALRQLKINGRSPIEDPLVRHKLADLTVGIQVSRMLSYRVAWMQHKGLVPNMESSINQCYSTEMSQKLVRTLLPMFQHYGMLSPKQKRAPAHGRMEYTYMTTISMTIAAGASEIQRNIIATRGLGLPR